MGSDRKLGATSKVQSEVEILKSANKDILLKAGVAPVQQVPDSRKEHLWNINLESLTRQKN